MSSTNEIAVSIERPSGMKAKTPPNLACKLTAAMIVMSVGFIVMSTIAGIALSVALNAKSDLDALRFSIDVLEGSSEKAKLSTSAIAPSGYKAISLFDGEWAAGVQMPVERSDHQAIYCVGKIVIIGGLDAAAQVSSTTWLFDPVLEIFDTAKPMPTPRFRFGAACLNGKVYVAGGYPTKAAGDAGQCLSTVDVYDVAGDVWMSATPMSLARGDLALSTSGGKLFAMGGYGYEYPYPDPANSANEAYDPEHNRWVAMASMPAGGKGDISAAEIDGIIYVPGGWNERFQDGLEAYNVSADAWVAGLAKMSRARGDKALAVLDGHIYVVGGEIWSGKTEPCSWDPSTTCNINARPIHSCELYSPSSDAWVGFAPMPAALFRFAAAAANGIIFAFGGQGHGQTAVNTVSIFLHQQRPDVYLHVQDA